MPESGKRALSFERMPQDGSESPKGENFLLAIGIDTYKDKQIPNLHNAVKDTASIVGLLQAEYEFYPDYTFTLYDEEANRESILHTLDQLTGSLQENDNLIIYLAGHGYYRKRRKLGYLIPYDGMVKSPSSLILHSTIRSYLESVEARHILIIADTCFSGGLMATRSLETDSSTLAERLEVFPSRYVLAAGRIEEVEDGIRGDHSPFAKSVLTFLDDKKGQSFPISDLAQHVKRTVPRNASQTPMAGRMFRMGDQDGEFVFHRKSLEHARWMDTNRQKDSFLNPQMLQEGNAEVRNSESNAVSQIPKSFINQTQSASPKQILNKKWMIAGGGALALIAALMLIWKANTSPVVIGEAPHGYVYKKADLYGFMNKNHKVVTKARYDSTEAFVNDYALVYKNGKRGFVNDKGEEILAPQYDLADDFGLDFEGLARVKLGESTFYINQDGEPSVPAYLEEILKEIEDNMVKVSGGTFQMGSEKGDEDEQPRVTINLSSFFINKFELTQAQYEAITGTNPSKFSTCAACPVEWVSWYDTQSFLKRLNALSGMAYRLPTEAEWEYAATGGQKNKGFTLADSYNPTLVSWCKENADKQTHPVGLKKANELGLYDMSGNVWEWCNDWYAETTYAHTDGTFNPTGPKKGEFKTRRGSSWRDTSAPFNMRLSDRAKSRPDAKHKFLGFRIAKDK